MGHLQDAKRAVASFALDERRLERILFSLFLAAGILIAWKAVSWSTSRDFYLFQDELGNLAGGRLLTAPYSDILHLFPSWFYNDRPVGLAIERALYDAFGLHYASQLLCYLVLHFANCVLAYVLSVRLGIDKRLALAGAAVFAGLSTTALTATYIGAVFDVICTLFALGSLVATLQRRHLLSAALFLLALRSKEWAVALPVLNTLLAIHQNSDWTPRAWLRAGGRLWLQWALLAVIGVRYLTFLPKMREVVTASDPYRLVLSFPTFLRSLAYYTGLVFGMEEMAGRVPLLVCALLGAVAAYGLARGRISIWYGVVAYVATLFFVCLLPNIRAPYYVYGPQVFLLLALCGVVQECTWTLIPAVRWRQLALAFVGIAILGQLVAFRCSPYFRDRVLYTQNARRTCAITAKGASRLSSMGHGAHVYINNGTSTPYLFTPGPCDYFRVITGTRGIGCVLDKPESELLVLYKQDPGEKYWLDYSSSGEVVIRSHEKGPPLRDETRTSQ